MSNKIIINFCPTGMVPTKEMTPFVPISAEEIIEQTHEAYEIGITIVHLHVRDENGVPCYKKTRYQQLFEGIKKHCPDLVICGSTSGRNFKEFEKRSEVIELQPDLCSLTLSSLNFLNQESVNSPDMIKKLALKMKDFGVNPELECFNLGMINYGKYLIDKGIIEGSNYWNLIFGNIAGYQANLAHINAAISEIPTTDYIGLGGIGNYQLPVNSLGIAMGYGIRIGIEDNIWWNKEKTKQSSNIDLIKRAHTLIEINQKELFKPSEFGALGFYNKNRQ